MNETALRLAARLFDKPLIDNQYRSAFVEAMIEPHLAPRGWRPSPVPPTVVPIVSPQRLGVLWH